MLVLTKYIPQSSQFFKNYHCYLQMVANSTYDQASDTCRRVGQDSTLVTIHSEAEKNFVESSFYLIVFQTGLLNLSKKLQTFRH